MFSIFFLICSLLILHAATSLSNTKTQIKLANSILRELLAAGEVRADINRQAKELSDYIASGEMDERDDFEKYTAETRMALDEWAEASKKSVFHGAEYGKGHAQKISELKRHYNAIMEDVEPIFELYESGQRNKAGDLVENGIEHSVDQVLEEFFDELIADEMQDLKESYSRLLICVGTTPRIKEGVMQRLESARTALNVFVAADSARLFSIRQVKEAIDLITTGGNHDRGEYEEIGDEAAIAFDNWLKLVENTRSAGGKGGTLDTQEIKKILAAYDDVQQVLDNGVRLYDAEEKEEAFEHLEEDLEPLLDDKLVPLISEAIQRESDKIKRIHEEVEETMLSALMSDIVALIAILSLALVIIISIIRGIIRSLGKLVTAAETIGSGELGHRVGLTGKDEFGRLAGAFNQMTDNLQHSEEELRKSTEQLSITLRSIGDAVVVADNQGDVVLMNSVAEKLTGWSEGEAVGRNTGETFRIADEMTGTQLESPVQKVLREGKVIGLANHTILIAKNGTQIPIADSGAPIRNNEGDIIGVVLVFRDESEKRKSARALQKAHDELEQRVEERTHALAKANQELEQSNRDLEQFAYIASHDLREPLRKILTFGDRLVAKCSSALGEQGLGYLERMQNASTRMQTMIDDLLSLSRITTHANPYVQVDLAEVVKGVVSDLEVGIEEMGAHVEVGDLPVINADPLQMRQLFQNLISNALKFQRKGESPVVKISGSFLKERRRITDLATDGLCQITVADNGIGFDEKDLIHIFGMFQRLHGRAEYEGTGIGLAVCKRIIDRHGGNITAKSKPGQGATFIITLPVIQPKGEPRDEKEEYSLHDSGSG